MMFDKSKCLKEILQLARSELKESGDSIGYTMPDGKHHIFIYVDNADDKIYVCEPNRVEDGAHEPFVGDTYLAAFGDLAELSVGCLWCMDRFDEDKGQVLTQANAVGDPRIEFDLGPVLLVAEPNCDKDYKEIIVGLMDHDGAYIQDLAVIGPEYTCGDNYQVVLGSNLNVRVYSDKNNEDYTHCFSVGVCSHEEEKQPLSSLIQDASSRVAAPKKENPDKQVER